MIHPSWDPETSRAIARSMAQARADRERRALWGTAQDIATANRLPLPDARRVAVNIIAWCHRKDRPMTDCVMRNVGN